MYAAVVGVDDADVVWLLSRLWELLFVATDGRRKVCVAPFIRVRDLSRVGLSARRYSGKDTRDKHRARVFHLAKRWFHRRKRNVEILQKYCREKKFERRKEIQKKRSLVPFSTPGTVSSPTGGVLGIASGGRSKTGGQRWRHYADSLQVAKRQKKEWGSRREQYACGG